jgi:hypothetical protein
MSDDNLHERVAEEAAEAEAEQTVLVRIVEWLEWMPGQQHGPLAMTNGVTSFKSLKHERLIDLGVSGTGRNYEWEEDDPDNEGEKITQHYGLYAFQAVLAQNMSDALARSLIAAQAMPMEEELQRDKEAGGRDRREDLLVIEHPKPNRNDRRGNKAKPRRKHR